MNRLKPYIYLISLTSFVSTQALAQTKYHVDPSGSDWNPGTIGSPWKTVSNANYQATAGDTIFINAGTYNEKLDLKVSGNSSGSIVFIGDSINKPVLDGTGLTPSGREGLISINTKSYLVFQNLEIANFSSNSNNTPVGIYIDGFSNNILVKNCVIHDIKQSNNNDGAHGIAVFGTSGTPIYNVNFINNEIYNCQLRWSEAFVLNGNVKDFLLDGNTVHHCDNIAFDFIGHENECSSCSGNGEEIDRARDGIVRNNTAYNIDTKDNPVYNNERSAAGFYVDGGTNILFEGNTAHDCNLGIELASEHFGKPTDFITVRNNVIYKNHVAGVATGGYDSGTGAGGGSAENCKIINNTFYKNNNSSRNNDDWGAEIFLQNRNVNNVYKNNIVYAGSGRPRTLINGSNNSNNEFGNNLYYGSTAGTENGVVVSTNPLFASESTFEFSLSISSPAINQGENLDSTFIGTVDFSGNTRINNATVDLGAYEYKSIVTHTSYNEKVQALKLYPNPVDKGNLARINIENIDALECKVYTLEGLLMAKQTGSVISTTNLKVGVYIIHLSTANQKYSGLLVVK